MKNILKITLALSFLFPVLSFAQEEGDKIFPNTENVSAEQVTNDSRNDVTNVPESTVIKDKYAGQYQKSTVKNLSKLYWLKGILDLENDQAIDSFILINECDYYRKHIKDDFKWEKVRDAARRMILENVDSYSDKYKIIIPIDLGRYDPDRKGFPLVNETAFKELSRVQVGGNDDPVCGLRWNIPYHPKNAHLILNKPFDYDFMEMDEHLAQAYILRNNKHKPKRPKEIQTLEYNRLAFARIRLRFMEYQEEKKQVNRTLVSVWFGKIDGIDIFENADETGLLSSVDY